MRRGFLVAALLAPLPLSAQVVLEMTPDRVREALRATTPACYDLAPSIGCLRTPYSRVAAVGHAARRGAIVLPLLNDLPVAGLTAAAIQRKVTGFAQRALGASGGARADHSALR